MLTRAEVQEKILTLKDQYPDKDNDFIKDQLSTWFDSTDLSNHLLTQEEMKQRLLSDLVTYEGWET